MFFSENVLKAKVNIKKKVKITSVNSCFIFKFEIIY